MPKLRPVEIAERFAQQVPIGTPCRYYPVKPCTGPGFIKTKIRSAPWVLGHGDIVVAVEGMTGGKSIEHIRFDPAEAPAAAAAMAEAWRS